MFSGKCFDISSSLISSLEIPVQKLYLASTLGRLWRRHSLREGWPVHERVSRSRSYPPRKSGPSAWDWRHSRNMCSILGGGTCLAASPPSPCEQTKKKKNPETSLIYADRMALAKYLLVQKLPGVIKNRLNHFHSFLSWGQLPWFHYCDTNQSCMPFARAWWFWAMFSIERLTLFECTICKTQLYKRVIVLKCTA